jgi:hypothetical protein
MTKENIIEKIQKLAAHAESAKKIGSLAEAELFASKVSELLLQHKLEMDDITNTATEDDVIDKERFNMEDHGGQYAKKRCSWQESLAHYVAEYHFCKIMVVIGSNTLFFVGRKEDRACAIYLFTYLVKAIGPAAQRLYDKEYNKHYAVGTTHLMRDWKHSFYIGAILALASRFQAERAKVEAAQSAEHSEQFALVLQRSEKELTDFIEEETTGKATSTAKPGINPNGYRQGQRHGSEVSLTQALETSGSAGQLTV